MTDPKLILRSHLSKGNIALRLSDMPFIERAMIEYAERSIDEYRSSETKAINKEAVSLLPSLISGSLKLWIRNFYFKRANKHAQTLSDMINRKVYVIRCSDVNYTLLSTKDVELNKRTHVMGKNVGAKELTDTADFVAYPSGYGGDNARLVKKLK
jgi:hypothetical protein